jgi:hypothetical protein
MEYALSSVSAQTATGVRFHLLNRKDTASPELIMRHPYTRLRLEQAFVGLERCPDRNSHLGVKARIYPERNQRAMLVRRRFLLATFFVWHSTCSIHSVEGVLGAMARVDPEPDRWSVR